MMKQTKILRLSALSLAMAAAFGTAPVANAEVSASVAIANMYLWRGNNLGDSDSVGTPAISGDLSYSSAGFYTGVWMSSGDASAGTEYDLYAGYGAEFGGVTVDLSVWTYAYPNTPGAGEGNNDPGDLSEVILSLGLGGASFTYYDNISGTDYSYMTLGYGAGAFSALIGAHDQPETPEEDDMIHIDLSYAYNDNLSFTISQQIEEETDQGRPKFVVSYSLPIE